MADSTWTVAWGYYTWNVRYGENEEADVAETRTVREIEDFNEFLDGHDDGDPDEDEPDWKARNR